MRRTIKIFKNLLFHILLLLLISTLISSIILSSYKTSNAEISENLKNWIENSDVSEITETCEYTFHFNPNEGNGTINDINETVTTSSKPNSEFNGDKTLEFPICSFNAPLFKKFKCWSWNNKEFQQKEKVSILESFKDSYKTNSTDPWYVYANIKTSYVEIDAVWEIDGMQILITLTIIVVIILLIIMLLYFKLNIKIFNDAFRKNSESKNEIINDLSFTFADEILEYKKLYDNKIITKREFEAKKKELLNL